MASTRRSESGVSNEAAISSVLGTLKGVACDGRGTDAVSIGAEGDTIAVTLATDDFNGEGNGAQSPRRAVLVGTRAEGAFGLKHERGGLFGEGARWTVLQREDAKCVREGGGASGSLSLVSLSLTNAGMSLGQIGPGLGSTSPQSLMSRAASRRRSNGGARK